MARSLKYRRQHDRRNPWQSDRSGSSVFLHLGMVPPMNFEIETKVAGIPCRAEMMTYWRGYPATREDPEDPAEAEFRILDRRGRHAPWLEQKLTAEDVTRIENELIYAYESLPCERY